jgi:hypothetical protein
MIYYYSKGNHRQPAATLAVCRGKYTSKHGDSSRQLCTEAIANDPGYVKAEILDPL